MADSTLVLVLEIGSGFAASFAILWKDGRSFVLVAASLAAPKAANPALVHKP